MSDLQPVTQTDFSRLRASDQASFRPTRRAILQATTASLAAFAMPTIIPASAFGANERIVTGHIGVGGRGRENLGGFHSNVAAICDVEQLHLERAGNELAKKNIKVDSYSDYRKLLERKDIDAVVISTPDHWHAIPTIEACQAGKDVYVEKPLSLTIDEGKAMRAAARQYDRIVQTGSQQRSADNFRYACELVRSGILGKLSEVHVGIAHANHPFEKTEPVADSDPPKSLDYNTWIGPAPFRPYNSKRVHYNFRFFWDFSGGQMTNWGAHHIDIAHWGMGCDDSGPLTVEGTAEFHPKGWHDVSESCRINYQYPDNVLMIVGQKQKDIQMGTKFIGENGWIYVNRGVLKASDPEFLKREIGTEHQLYKSANHYQNFLECVVSRKKSICDVAIGHRTATACHLGNLAIRTGKKIQWDATQEKIIADTELEAMQQRSPRENWR